MKSALDTTKILLAGLPLVLAGCWANTEHVGSTNIMADETKPGASCEPAANGGSEGVASKSPEAKSPEAKISKPTKTELATFGAGCFWCVEAVFEQIDGVINVTSGYMGGKIDNPTYEQVCSGTTGHAEVSQLTFDPSRVSFGKLLETFWTSHDPTTLNRQGADVGTQYRSAIFYHCEEQRETAEASKKAIAESKLYRDPIVTEITTASKYYEAEDYHQDYYRLNKRAPYCQYVIAPKLDKLGLKK